MLGAKHGFAKPIVATLEGSLMLKGINSATILGVGIATT